MNISFYGSHDASACFRDEHGQLRIFEVERFCKKRYAAWADWIIPHCDGPSEHEKLEFLDLIKKTSGQTEFENCYYNQLFDSDLSLLKSQLGIKSFVKCSHHRGHAISTMHQSPFDKSLIFSFDGGGHDDHDHLSFFNVFIGDRKANQLTHIESVNVNFGTAYANIATPMVEIKKSKNINVYSGKLMGLSSYGSVRTDWIQPMLDYYHHLDISKLLREINLPTDIEGHLSYDLARTSQHVFERLFLNTFSRIYPKFGLPVCLTGGCALNVLNNGTIKDTIGEENVFVPPNPNDCGLSMGFFLENNPPEGVLNVEFSGMDIQNRQFELPSSVPTDVKKITDLLLAGQIIGVVIGQSECGPRALGHRSIICYPEHPNLKDKLNSEIKFREWFRPFAPVVLEEDMPIYFSGIKKSPTMSFAPKFNVGWTRRFPAVEHIDGTGRVQSVTSTNELFYEILLELKRRNKPGILLNTSFNIRGKPLINDLKDVVETFNTSRLNGLIVENQMVIKP